MEDSAPVAGGENETNVDPVSHNGRPTDEDRELNDGALAESSEQEDQDSAEQAKVRANVLEYSYALTTLLYSEVG